MTSKRCPSIWKIVPMPQSGKFLADKKTTRLQGRYDPRPKRFRDRQKSKCAACSDNKKTRTDMQCAPRLFAEGRIFVLHEKSYNGIFSTAIFYEHFLLIFFSDMLYRYSPRSSLKTQMSTSQPSYAAKNP